MPTCYKVYYLLYSESTFYIPIKNNNIRFPEGQMAKVKAKSYCAVSRRILAMSAALRFEALDPKPGISVTPAGLERFMPWCSWPTDLDRRAAA